MAPPFIARFYHPPYAGDLIQDRLAEHRKVADIFPGGQEHDIDEFSFFSYIKRFILGVI